jgi:hypothetical protein
MHATAGPSPQQLSHAFAISQYEGGVPCSVCGHRLQPTAEKGQLPSAYPSEILPGFLYLGNYDNASRCELLKALDITHILNVRLIASMHDKPGAVLAPKID